MKRSDSTLPWVFVWIAQIACFAIGWFAALELQEPVNKMEIFYEEAERMGIINNQNIIIATDGVMVKNLDGTTSLYSRPITIGVLKPGDSAEFYIPIPGGE